VIVVSRYTFIGSIDMADYLTEIRKEIGHTKLLVVGTACIVTNADGEVLQMLRSETKEWGLIGGFMDLEETIVESLGREIREETGLEIQDYTLFGIYSGSEFDSTHISGQLQQSEESDELRFFSIDHLPEPMNPSSARLLKDYCEYREDRQDIPTIL
jgi:ADP-ribose pyrophosphatase YjhB (NUDIX family)